MNEMFRRRMAAAVCVLALVFVAVPAAGQDDEDQPRELADWERAELQGLVEVVGAAVKGELTQTEQRS